jgi:hypothetical protein
MPEVNGHNRSPVPYQLKRAFVHCIRAPILVYYALSDPIVLAKGYCRLS